ncbi:MAG TPA: DUF2383 domain-containing protein [Polyangiaceae bacterium]|nr:DUF2383 domain-containing protein [Polyangiaceae bacterium]
MSNETTASITLLNAFLRSEMSAAETYHQVLRRATDATTRATLEDCSSSHESRTRRLRDAIELMGGTPASDAGVLGTFAGLAEGAARALGGRATASALARGEARGLREYRDNLGRLDAQGKELVEDLLLPAQEHTTRVIHDLSRMLS